MQAMLRRDRTILLETGKIVRPGDSGYDTVAAFLRNPFTTFVDDWQPYQGRFGGHGWRNPTNGEVLYQDAKPGSNGKTATPASNE